MAKDPSALMRGLIFGAAWLVWVSGGYAYALMHSPVRAWLSDAAPLVKVAVVVWVFVSASLLFCALMYTIRGFARSHNQPRA